MIELQKDDIPILDFIIDELCKPNVFFIDLEYLKNVKKNNFKNSILLEEGGFKRIASIIDKYDCVETNLKYPFSGKLCISEGDDLFQFKKQGGFKKLYEDLLENNQHKKVLRNKEINDATISNWKVKTFWYFFVFAIIGTLLSFYNFKNSLSPSKITIELNQKVEKMELELKKLQISPFVQKNLDSLNNHIEHLKK